MGRRQRGVDAAAPPLIVAGQQQRERPPAALTGTGAERFDSNREPRLHVGCAEADKVAILATGCVWRLPSGGGRHRVEVRAEQDQSAVAGGVAPEIHRAVDDLSLIPISEPTRPLYTSSAVFCLTKKTSLHLVCRLLLYTKNI